MFAFSIPLPESVATDTQLEEFMLGVTNCVPTQYGVDVEQYQTKKGWRVRVTLDQLQEEDALPIKKSVQKYGKTFVSPTE